MAGIFLLDDIRKVYLIKYFFVGVSVTNRSYTNVEIQMRTNMIGEIALAIEMGADAVDIGKTIHPLSLIHI
jgi:hypothetical protein